MTSNKIQIVHWLHGNMVEIHDPVWLRSGYDASKKIKGRKLRRSSFGRVAQLEQAIHDYLVGHNRKAKLFTGTASADLMLGKVQHLSKELI